VKWLLTALLLLAAPAWAQTPTPTPPVSPPCPIPTPAPTGIPTATPTAAATATPTSIPKTPQQRKVAILLVNSPDGTSVINAQQAEELMWTNEITSSNTTLPASYKRFLISTYNIVEFLWDGNGDAEYDIFGPYESEHLADGECHYTDWGSDAYAEAVITNPELADYDNIVISLPWVDGSPPRANACPWGGLGQVGGRHVWLNSVHAGVLTHELEHTFGILHLVDFAPDPTDIFGAQGIVAGLNTPHLDRIGVLPSSSVVEVYSKKQQQSFLLLSMAIDPYTVLGYRAVKTEVPNGDVYYISFRGAAVGMDTYLEAGNTFSVYIHRVDSASNRVEPMDIIVDGESFSDGDGTFTVTVTDISQGAQSWEAQVAVTFLTAGSEGIDFGSGVDISMNGLGGM
jgi:hypothetical protein